jgi:hypothetical protein
MRNAPTARLSNETKINRTAPIKSGVLQLRELSDKSRATAAFLGL